MRESIVRQYASLPAVHVYLQKPSTHFFGVAAVPPHWLSSVQFGFGRVSRRQIPWSQKLPAPHSGSAEHVFTQVPWRQVGAAGVQL